MTNEQYVARLAELRNSVEVLYPYAFNRLYSIDSWQAHYDIIRTAALYGCTNWAENDAIMAKWREVHNL